MAKTETREAIVLTNKENKLFGILHRPLSDHPSPAVLMCHGFGGDKLGKHRLYLNLAKELASNGISTLRFDFEACGDSEGEFEEVTIEHLVGDAESALKFLLGDPRIDKSRLGILGRSLGAAIAVLTASRTQAFKSMALWTPFFTAESWKGRWETLRKTDDPSKREAIMTINGKKAGFEFYEELFKINLAEDLKKLQNLPLLHIHGKQDTTVNEVHTKGYHDSRVGASAETKYILLPNTDHDFSDLSERRLSMEETLDWFKRTL